MPRLYLVRHGEPAASYAEAPDPGLSDAGRAQAEAMAARLAPLGPLTLATSPTRRTRETAAALEQRWGVMAVVEPAVSEIPSPSDDLAARGSWLRDAMGQTWTTLGPRWRSWRDMVVGAFQTSVHDTVVVTHFFAINAALGAATGDDRVVVAPVEHASVTVLERGRDGLRLVEVGATRGIGDAPA